MHLSQATFSDGCIVKMWFSITISEIKVSLHTKHLGQFCWLSAGERAMGDEGEESPVAMMSKWLSPFSSPKLFSWAIFLVLPPRPLPAPPPLGVEVTGPSCLGTFDALPIPAAPGGRVLFLPPPLLGAARPDKSFSSATSWESLALWVLLCLCMFPLVVKVCPQRRQENGRSPEWTSMCLSKELNEESIFPQRQQ